jgi:predicted ATP-grasp superfamily ATP-dependent carboligase
MPAKKLAVFARMGEVLAKEFRLRGLFGIDYVVRNGKPYPIEINPRYTASVEVLEHALGINALRLHQNVFEGRETKPERIVPKRKQYVGKVILFAKQALIVPGDASWNAALDQPIADLRSFADIPPPGQHLDKGRPIVSLFSRSTSMNRCLIILRRRVEQLDHWLLGK